MASPPPRACRDAAHDDCMFDEAGEKPMNNTGKTKTRLHAAIGEAKMMQGILQDECDLPLSAWGLHSKQKATRLACIEESVPVNEGLGGALGLRNDGLDGALGPHNDGVDESYDVKSAGLPMVALDFLNGSCDDTFDIAFGALDSEGAASKIQFAQFAEMRWGWIFSSQCS